jgi:Flp pilus assembly protein TadD
LPRPIRADQVHRIEQCSRQPARSAAAVRSIDVALGVALAAAVLVTYAPLVGYDFINYDDPEYVAHNPHVTGGLTLRNVAWALTGVHASNWYPLTWMSHMLDYELFGLDAGGHHATSVLLHAGASVWLFVALRSATAAAWTSALAASLFAIHPLRVESVAWIAERKDVLAVFFWTLGLWCYVRWAARASLGRYLTLAAAFTLGLLSKGSVVTFPVACLLFDWWPLGRLAAVGGPPPARSARPVPLSRLIAEKVPLVVLGVIGAAITIVVQRRYAGGVVIEDYPLSTRAATVVLSYARYVLKTVWPSDLAVFYPLHHGTTGEVAAASIALAAITTVAFVQRRVRPWLIVGWVWFLITLAPMVDIVRIGGRDLADRYTYIASIGLAVMAAWSVRDAAGHPRARTIVAGAAATVVVASAVATRIQVGHWRNSITLYEHALAVTDGNDLAQYNLGVALADAGRADEAIARYREAIRIRPDYALAHGNLGKQLAARGEIDAAISHYEAALRAYPGFAEAHNNLAIALEASGRNAEATVHYAEAVRLSPERPDGYYNLAAALAGQGRVDEAIAQLESALRLQPTFLEARVALGNALAQTGRTAEALREYRAALADARATGREDLIAELAERVAARGADPHAR